MKKRKSIIIGTAMIVFLGISSGLLFLSGNKDDEKSNIDESIAQVSKHNYDKALKSVAKLKNSEQEKNIALYKIRINTIKKERNLFENGKYSEARALIKDHLEKYPVSEDEELKLQLILVEDLNKIDQLNKLDIKGLNNLNKAIANNKKGDYRASKKTIDGMSKGEKETHKKIISKLEEANKSQRDIDKEVKEKKLSDMLDEKNQDISIITQLKSDTSDNKDRGLVDVEVNLLIKNESDFNLVLEKKKFSVNNNEVESKSEENEIVILSGSSYLLENIVTNAQPNQLSGDLSYGANNLGKLVDVERGYFEDERWVQL